LIDAGLRIYDRDDEVGKEQGPQPQLGLCKWSTIYLQSTLSVLFSVSCTDPQDNLKHDIGGDFQEIEGGAVRFIKGPPAVLTPEPQIPEAGRFG